jgi:hypothetical protein
MGDIGSATDNSMLKIPEANYFLFELSFIQKHSFAAEMSAA